MSKKLCFGTHFESQHAKGSQTLLKSTRGHFYHIFLSLWGIFWWKMFLLVICEILGLSVNTFTADGKYFLGNSENLPQPIHMQFSKKQITFSKFFSSFLKSTSNLKYFVKKVDPHRPCIPRITDCKRHG